MQSNNEDHFEDDNVDDVDDVDDGDGVEDVVDVVLKVETAVMIDAIVLIF